nr:hypothetical protein [uncultured Haemophilus sp.]
MSERTISLALSVLHHYLTEFAGRQKPTLTSPLSIFPTQIQLKDDISSLLQSEQISKAEQIVLGVLGKSKDTALFQRD